MASYYVDATNGLDANAGTEAEPWQTVNKVRSTVLSAGDNVYFKRGETWQVEVAATDRLNTTNSGASGNPITYSAYGTGAKPRFDSPVFTGFALVSGEIYKTAATTEVKYNKVWEDNTRLDKGSAKDALNRGEWFWEANELFVRTTDGTAPSNFTIRGVTQFSAAVIGHDYITFDNLDFRYHNQAIFNTKTGVTIQNCDLAHNENHGMFNNGTPSLTVKDNTVTDCRTGACVYVTGVCGSELIEGNTVSYGALDKTSNAGNIWFFARTGATATVRYNTSSFAGTAAANLSSGIYCSGQTNDVDIYYNRGWDNEIGIALSGGGAPYNQNIRVWNNTFVRCTSYGIEIFDTQNSELKNNIFHSASGAVRTVRYNAFMKTAPGWTADYNLYWDVDTTDLEADGDPVETTIAGWTTLTGDEANSPTLADPLFTNLASNMLNLLSGSPGIDAGVDVSLTRDFAGTSLKGLPDLGAYEHGVRRTIRSPRYGLTRSAQQ